MLTRTKVLGAAVIMLLCAFMFTLVIFHKARVPIKGDDHNARVPIKGENHNERVPIKGDDHNVRQHIKGDYQRTRAIYSVFGSI